MVVGGEGGTINYSEGKTTSWLDQQISKLTNIKNSIIFQYQCLFMKRVWNKICQIFLYLHHIMFDMLHFIKYHRVKQKGTENAIKNELSNKFPLSRNDKSIACVGWFSSINCLLIDIKLSFEF